MTLPAPITDHAAQALAKFTTPFKGRPRFAAWCTSQVNRVQETEDMLQAFLRAFDLDTCDLPRLMIIAKIVGQTPVGTLETFRRMVKARIQVNRTDTTAPTLIRIAMLLTGGPVYYSDGGCAIWIEALTPLPADVDPTLLVSMLREAKMAGVQLNLLEQADTDPLLWGNDASLTTATPGTGFSDDLGTEGGTVAGDY